MSDSGISDGPIVGFDQTNGMAGDLEGESDGTAAGEDHSAGDRGPSPRDQDPYVAESVQEQSGDDQQAVDPAAADRAASDAYGNRTGD